MKQLTPIEELIPAFRKWTKEWEKYEYNPLENPKPQSIDDFIKPFLEKEKQVIVDAVNETYNSVIGMETGYMPTPIDGEDYYNNKYSK